MLGGDVESQSIVWGCAMKWSEATISADEINDARSLIGLFFEKGVPLGDDRYIREMINNQDGTYTYRWASKYDHDSL